MREGEPSRTALAAATHRAIHQVAEGGLLFDDELAVRILSADPAALRAEAAANPRGRAMRLFIAARHRIAEDAVTKAVARGVRQIVVLGAGLDTQAYRNPYGDAVTIFEVDHPATQAWKLARLAKAHIEIPPRTRFVAVNFESESFIRRLEAGAFDPANGSFFVWLGVVPYLTEAAIFATLSSLAALPGGTEVVFDYADPPSAWPSDLRAMLEATAGRAEAVGEAWISYFEAGTLADRLRGLGFAGVEDFGPAEIGRYFFQSTLHERGGHVLRAWT